MTSFRFSSSLRKAALLLMIAFQGCSGETDKNNSSLTDSSQLADNSLLAASPHSPSAASSGQINYTDAEGRKQGKWKEYKKDSIRYDVLQYKDGELDGLQIYMPFGDTTMKLHAKYSRGKKHDLSLDYWQHAGSEVSFKGQWGELAVHAHYFENDVLKWQTFPAANFMAAWWDDQWVKGIGMYTDTSYVMLYYKNGVPFYEGKFVVSAADSTGVPIGIHQRWFPRGQLWSRIEYGGFDKNLKFPDDRVTPWIRNGEYLLLSPEGDTLMHRNFKKPVTEIKLDKAVWIYLNEKF